jgi:hypothetical protein
MKPFKITMIQEDLQRQFNIDSDVKFKNERLKEHLEKTKTHSGGAIGIKY